MKKRLSVSVVIPTKDRVQQICECIDSIQKQTYSPDEIIVIDSSKTPLLKEILKEKFTKLYPKIKYIYSDVSTSAARNIGGRSSSGDIVFIFDDDVVLHSDYIKEVVKVFASDREGRVGGVMGRITNIKEDANPIKNIVHRLFFLSHTGDGKILPSGLETWVNSKNKIVKTESLSGCMQAYRKKVFDNFLFDEELGRLSGYCYSEDLDFSYRVSRKYALLYTPFAKIEHRPSQVSRIHVQTFRRQHIFNHFYLFRKNMPKHFTNLFAFCLSVFGFFLLTLLRGNMRGVIGVLHGIIDGVFPSLK